MVRADSRVDGEPTVTEFERILQVCDSFEALWRRGEGPRIEELLARNPSVSRPALLRELLALELELAKAGGAQPTARDYQVRFPDCAQVIEGIFADRGPTTAGPRVPEYVNTESQSPPLPESGSSCLPPRIGRYVVVSLLDAGGQGQVFRVIHPGLRKDLVLKLAARPAPNERSGGQLLTAEGRLLAELDHPNLVRVLDLDVHEDGRPFVVMEYVAGCTLERHIEQGLPPPRRAAAIVAEIARAVGYVHGRGVVHQDIKPRNVLIDEQGRPRLIDFGVARLRHAWADETLGPSGGTLMFMAPEQARGETERMSPAADIYALGGLLYFLLSGRSPVGGGTRSEVYERARRGAVDVSALESSAAPRRLRQICLKALSPEPADRFAAADDLAKQLERVAQGPRRATRIAACVLLIIALISALALMPRSERVVAPPALVGSDQNMVNIQRHGDPYELREAVPLRNGDKLWVSCKIPHGARPSMFWVDSEGAVTELTPDVDVGVTADSLLYPPSAPIVVVPLQGQPGTELVLVCARRDKPVVRQEIEAILGAGRRLPMLPDRVIVRLELDGVEPTILSGSRSIGAPVASDLAAALDPLRTLQRKLRDETSFLSGIAFPHVAD